MSSESDSEIVNPRSTQTNNLDWDSNDIKTIISDCVQYVITNSQKKYPIKKQNLSKDCLRGKGRLFNVFLQKINKNLEDYFGMRLVEVPEKSTPQFILVNSLDIVEINYFEKSKDDYILNGILIPVLGVIFMLKGDVKEDIIWNFLKTLDLNVEDNKKFGPLNYTLKQLLTNLWVKQLYLDYRKVSEGDEQFNIFNWGFRSECEINKKALLSFVSNIYDAGGPETWHEQFAAAVDNIESESDA